MLPAAGLTKQCESAHYTRGQQAVHAMDAAGCVGGFDFAPMASQLLGVPLWARHDTTLVTSMPKQPVILLILSNGVTCSYVYSMTTECSSTQSCDTSSMSLSSSLEVDRNAAGNTSAKEGSSPTRRPINPNKILKRKNTPVSLPTVRKLSGEQRC